MDRSRHTPSALLLLTIGFLFASLTHAQPTPGKEQIVIDLPVEYRWKRTQVRKDTKSIRETVYHVSGRNAGNSTVETVRINTIDRRYFPMSSSSAPTDKLNFLKATCPESRLEILDRKVVDMRHSVLFSIQSDVEGFCGETVFLSYVVEGPTAYHTIELEITKTSEITGEIAKWSELLLEAEIK